MAFTAQIFVFLFFPFSISLYYLIELLQRKSFFSNILMKIRAKDLLIVFISLLFYAWAGISDTIRLLIYILFVYSAGCLIQWSKKYYFLKVSNTKDHIDEKSALSLSKIVLAGVIIGVLLILVHFKYMSMTSELWNFLFKDTISSQTIIAPLGISFITFSTISYLVDISIEKGPKGTLLDCTLYLLFFPKIVSGPIILWRDFSPQIAKRKVSIDLFYEGVNRIMIGFGKKIVLADSFGACIATCAGIADIPTAWGISFLYMLQIYYDFSGYSDIAIGLSNLLGFNAKENFNFPYLSCSITEFWRRWHISLGTWFREYIYFPLGGSKKGKLRTIMNIGVVFLLTGIWHGAGWTYMLWGIINGLCNILEKLIKDVKLYINTPNIIKWLFTMVIVFFSWQLFRFESIGQCGQWFMTMIGKTYFYKIPYMFSYYFDRRMILLCIIATTGATLWGIPCVQKKYINMCRTKLGSLINELIIVGVFLISILFMINAKYSPFIYFQY